MTDDEETIFPASPAVQGQAESRRAYQQLLDDLNQYSWWQDYRELTRRGWDWRKAVLIAWEASPAKSRSPATQEELATKVLGLTSDRVIAKWREKHPEMAEEVARMQAAPLLRHRRDVFDALAESAGNPDPKNHPDRKLALEMMGDYKPGNKVQLEGGDTPIETKGTLILEHTIDGDTAETIFGILASIGAIESAPGDAEDDEVHPAESDA
jgi:hypothetical protein